MADSAGEMGMPVGRTTVWGRRLAVVVMIFAAPGAAAAAQEVISSVIGVDYCDGGPCEDGAPRCCPRACTYCACCAHPGAVPITAQLLASEPMTGSVAFGWYTGGAYSSGCPVPPFRPPAP